MTQTHVWIAPDGTRHRLDGTEGVKILKGVQGRGMPPMETYADEVAGLDGSRPRLSRALERRPVLPAMVSGDDWRARVRTLASLFDPRKGDGKLRVEEDGAAFRELVCRYAQGMELDEGEGTSNVQFMVLAFTAHDPMWQDTAASVKLVDIESLAFLNSSEDEAWFPWQLVSEDAVGGFTIDNDGDDDAWPIWTVQGPGGPVTLSNSTTGETLAVDTVLAAGEQLSIDTRPGRKTVTGPSGENLYEDLSDASVLWPIEPGEQQIAIELENAEAGQSNVRLEYRRRWLTA